MFPPGRTTNSSDQGPASPECVLWGHRSATSTAESGKRATSFSSEAAARRCFCCTASRRPTAAGSGSRRGWAETYQVVTPDLRGYGASLAPLGGPHGEGYSKREMAAELVELMAGMGHERFMVVGHDRGARVAYRMALDHPGVTIQVALLNVLPTVVQFEQMGGGPSLGYWPWLFLAQPAPFPERLVSADPEALLEHVFATWAGNPDAISADSRAAYRAAMTPETIAAMCADYRASLHLDRQHDYNDRQAGHRITVPVLLVTGEDETQLADASDIWRGWTFDLRAVHVPGGHFIPRRRPTS
jgi:haloacetate dehalogenase